MKLVIDPESAASVAMLINQMRNLPKHIDPRSLTPEQAKEVLMEVAEYRPVVLFEETREVTTDYDPATGGYDGHHEERLVTAWQPA